jgi:LmbE family N-acetylglucosaminyl deacetylase
VTAAVSELVGFGNPRGLWCLAPWEPDGHPDHDAVGRATAAACSAYRVPLLRYPIAAAQRIRSSAPAYHQMHQLTLTAPVRRRKRRALMRLRVGNLAGDIEQVAPTEVFVGDLAPEGGSSRGAGSRRPRPPRPAAKARSE